MCYMSKAWYSVVQYRPRLDRAEGANVGVLLFAPDKGFLDLRMSSSAKNVRKMFGRTAVDSARFALATKGLARRVKDQATGARSSVELRRVLRREANQLQFGRLLETSTKDPRATLDELFAELVADEKERQHRPRGGGKMNKKRNPTAVFQALGQVLLKYPELRVGQAIVNALPARYGNDAFYIEDDELAECLRALADG